MHSDSDGPKVAGCAGGVGYTCATCGYKDRVREFARSRAWPCVKIGGEGAREGPAGLRQAWSWVRGAQSRPPDIVDGGAVCESLSIATEKDETMVLGPMNEPAMLCAHRTRCTSGPEGSEHHFKYSLNEFCRLKVNKTNREREREREYT